MTTDEIEKAAIVYDRELKRHPLSSEALREDLVKFGQIVNDHWQEKTRWIPVKERLPKVRKTPFFIAVTAHDGGDKFRANIKTFLIRDESDIRWMVMNCKYWKEIE